MKYIDLDDCLVMAMTQSEIWICGIVKSRWIGSGLSGIFHDE